MATLKYKDKNGQWQKIAVGGDSTEVIDSLDSESTTAALSANQGRVLKEMIVQSGGGGGGSIDPATLENYTPIVREFSDEFNNDFTS